MSAVNSVAGLLRRAYGNLVVLSELRGQRRVPYLPREEQGKLRDARLRAVVRYAARTVPYYRDLFRAERLSMDDIRSVDDLHRLPLLDKATVRRDPARFVSDSRRGRTAIPFFTSGSTGQRLEVRHDRRSLLANIAFGEREREVLSRLCGRVLGYREAYVLNPGSTVERVQDFYHGATLIPVRPERLFLSVADPVDAVAAAINSFRPHVLVSFASYLENLYRVLAARGVSVHAPKVVIYVGEGMPQEARRLIEEWLGVPVLSRYNAMEAFKIGYLCEERQGFHLHEDLCDVRIIDASGKDQPDGEKGEVVISNLVNRGTVLLNYRLGDVACLSRQPCGCGRTQRLLTDLEGRLEDTLVLDDGRFVHPRVIWGVFRGRREVLGYQLVQEARTRFELRLVMTNARAYDQLVDGMVAELRVHLGQGAHIEVRRYDELPRSSGGKFRPVIALGRAAAP